MSNKTSTKANGQDLISITADWNKIVEDEISFTFKIKTNDLKWDENIAFQYIKDLKDEVDLEFSNNNKSTDIAVRAFPSLLLDDYWSVVEMVEYVMKKRFQKTQSTMNLFSLMDDTDEEFNRNFMAEQILHNLAYWLNSILLNLPYVNHEIQVRCKQLFFRSMKKIEIFEQILLSGHGNNRDSTRMKSVLTKMTDSEKSLAPTEAAINLLNRNNGARGIAVGSSNGSVTGSEVYRETLVVPERESIVRMSVLSSDSPLAMKLHHHNSNGSNGNLLRASILHQYSSNSNMNSETQSVISNSSKRNSINSANGLMTRERSNSINSDTSIGSGRSYSHFKSIEVNEASISQFVKMLLSRGIRCQFMLPTRNNVATPCDCLIYFPESTIDELPYFAVKILTKGKKQVEPLKIDIQSIKGATKTMNSNMYVPTSIHEDFLFSIELYDKPEMCFCMDSMLRRDIAILAFPRALISKKAVNSNNKFNHSVSVSKSLSSSSDKNGENSPYYINNSHSRIHSNNNSGTNTPTALKSNSMTFFGRSSSGHQNNIISPMSPTLAATSRDFIGIANTVSFDSQQTSNNNTIKPINLLNKQTSSSSVNTNTTTNKRKTLTATLQSFTSSKSTNNLQLISFYWIYSITQGPFTLSLLTIQLLVVTNQNSFIIYQPRNPHGYGDKLLIPPEYTNNENINNTNYTERIQLSGMLDNLLFMNYPNKFIEDKQFNTVHTVNAMSIQSIEDISPSNDENIIRVNLDNRKIKIMLGDLDQRRNFIAQLSKIKRSVTKSED